MAAQTNSRVDQAEAKERALTDTEPRAEVVDKDKPAIKGKFLKLLENAKLPYILVSLNILVLVFSISTEYEDQNIKTEAAFNPANGWDWVRVKWVLTLVGEAVIISLMAIGIFAQCDAKTIVIHNGLSCFSTIVIIVINAIRPGGDYIVIGVLLAIFSIVLALNEYVSSSAAYFWHEYAQSLETNAIKDRRLHLERTDQINDSHYRKQYPDIDFQ